MSKVECKRDHNGRDRRDVEGALNEIAFIAKLGSMDHVPVGVEGDIQWVDDGLPLIALRKEAKSEQNY